MTDVTRRNLLGYGAAAGSGALVGLAGGFAGGFAVGDATADDMGGDVVDLSKAYPFYASSADVAAGVAHQAGISTPPQRHCVFMTFDVVPGTTKQQLQVLFARWSAGIAQLMAGLPVGAVEPTNGVQPPGDTGEAFDLAPSSLTVTFGIGPGIFDERFGLSSKAPVRLAPLPQLPSDSLDPALTGGDLSLQACADDPQVAYHAIRDLARIGRGTVTTRWTVMGFGRASAGAGQTTPRNLLGFKDGTRNLRTADEIDDFVWVGDDEPSWFHGGAYMVARKIQMNIEVWDTDRISDQEKIFGRHKQSGAPLTGTLEFDTPNFTATEAGDSVIDVKSHIALASHENNDGVRILRRGYNFTDGINDLGHLDAGLLFISYQHDPASFITLQTRLGSSDLLNEYIKHVGSGIFAVPPAPAQGHYFAEALFS